MNVAATTKKRKVEKVVSIALDEHEWKAVVNGLTYSVEKLIGLSADHFSNGQKPEGMICFENAKACEELKKKIEANLKA